MKKRLLSLIERTFDWKNDWLKERLIDWLKELLIENNWLRTDWLKELLIERTIDWKNYWLRTIDWELLIETDWLKELLIERTIGIIEERYHWLKKGIIDWRNDCYHWLKKTWIDCKLKRYEELIIDWRKMGIIDRRKEKTLIFDWKDCWLLSMIERTIVIRRLWSLIGRTIVIIDWKNNCDHWLKERLLSFIERKIVIIEWRMIVIDSLIRTIVIIEWRMKKPLLSDYCYHWMKKGNRLINFFWYISFHWSFDQYQFIWIYFIPLIFWWFWWFWWFWKGTEIIMN